MITLQNNSCWIKIGDVDGESAYDESGRAVALSLDGSVIAIGASTNDGNGSNSGHIRVYRNINNVWTQVGSDIDGESAYDSSGRAVAMSLDGSVLARTLSPDDNATAVPEFCRGFG